MSFSKNFKLGKGLYYFQIKSGQQNIVIKRDKKADAVRTYLSYVEVGKPCEWLGKWNGRKFEETEAPTPKESK